MPEFTVELIGESRELYTVEAETAEEARQNWADGSLYLQESSGMTVEKVTQDD